MQIFKAEINDKWNLSYFLFIEKQLLMETEKTWQTQGIAYLGYRVNVSQGQLAIGQQWTNYNVSMVTPYPIGYIVYLGYRVNVSQCQLANGQQWTNYNVRMVTPYPIGYIIHLGYRVNVSQRQLANGQQWTNYNVRMVPPYPIGYIVLLGYRVNLPVSTCYWPIMNKL